MQSDDKSRAAETLEDSEAALVAAGDPEVDHALRSTRWVAWGCRRRKKRLRCLDRRERRGHDDSFLGLDASRAD